VNPTPTVSVVIICQDDAERLPDAIRSAMAQSLTDIEIIVVDHGSTDDSSAVAQSFAEEDSRIRVITLPDRQGKPGRPLNAGFDAAKAPWVVAIGSDDKLRIRGCENALAAGERANADLVINGVLRVDVDTGETNRWMPGVTLRSRVVTDIAQLPEMLRDTIGGFKLYRTDFLRRNDIRFREDIFYQDQIFTARCYEAAKVVAISANYMGRWRRWSTSDRKSITQRKFTVENLSDRFEANRTIDEVLTARDRRDMLITKHQKFFTHDLGIHVKDLDKTSAEYQDRLVELTQEYVAGIPEEAFDGLPLNRWIMLQCLLAGEPTEAEEAAAAHFSKILIEWQRLTNEAGDYTIPNELPSEPIDRYRVDRYRLTKIPGGRQPVRGWISLTGHDKGFAVEVTVESPGRPEMDDGAAAALQLRNPSDGRFWDLPLGPATDRSGNKRIWRTHIAAAALTQEFGHGDIALSLYAGFHVGQPGYWRVPLRPADDQVALPAASSAQPWSVDIVEKRVELSRLQSIGLRDRIAHRLDVRRYPDIVTRDPLAELTRDQAADYLSDHRSRPRSNHVFFESFAGRRIDGAPWGLSQALRRSRPKWTQAWSGSHSSIFGRPAGTLAAPRFTRRYVDLLAKSGVWVDNGWLPFEPDGRLFLQLGSGVPLTRVESPSQVPSWTHLVTSGDYDSARLRELYGSSMPLLASGSPATDALLAPEAQDRRSQLRSRWGVSDRTVLLYLPALRTGQIAPEFRVPNLHRLSRDLGSDYYLFFREHDDDATGKRTAGVPDDLRWFAGGLRSRGQLLDYLLAADILISDYSSVIVDFGWTGRTVIHYAPDQKFYEDVDPGAYVKLDQLTAGPVVGDEAALVQAIREATTRISPDLENSMSRRFSEELAPLDALSSGEELIRLMGW
jgi:CDP-glycerol glycerophosphotransferase